MAAAASDGSSVPMAFNSPVRSTSLSVENDCVIPSLDGIAGSTFVGEPAFDIGAIGMRKRRWYRCGPSAVKGLSETSAGSCRHALQERRRGASLETVVPLIHSRNPMAADRQRCDIEGCHDLAVDDLQVPRS